MDFKTAVKAVRKGDIAPVYLLYGTEKYQMIQFVDMLQERIIKEEHREFSVISYDLTDTPVEVVVEEAETVPFLVPRKLVLVRDARVFTSGKDGGKVEHRLDALAAYIENPAQYSVLVFMIHADKLDERKKIVKQIKKAASVIAFSPLSSEELFAWVEKCVAKRHVALAAEAAPALIRNVGTSLQALAVEMDKLCLFAGEGGTISVQDIDALVARSTEQNVFVMVEELANLRLENALSIFYELLKQREEPIKIAALVTRQFRIILQVQQLAQQSYSQQQMAGQLGLHPYAVKIAGEQAARFRPERLRWILNELAELDYRMKTGAVDKVFGMELFFLKLGVGAQSV